MWRTDLAWATRVKSATIDGGAMSVSGGGRSIARLIFSGSLSVSRLKRFCFGFRGMAGCCEEPPSCGGTAARRGLSGTARRECGGAGRRRRT
eukprot:scaffold14240_cov36-Phaeocystis_antarctica.AAC.1